MEEDIRILEEMKNNCLTKRDYIDEKAERKAQAIENLINKNKELEKENKRLKKYWGNKIAEYHKVIKLMASFIWKYDCCKHEIIKDGKCKGHYKEKDCTEKCILDYFRKKAKGE